MKKKITVQNIADRLGLSRNTVSKALNNQQSIAEETRKVVIQTALDMGYKKLKFARTLNSSGFAKRTGNVVAVAHEYFVDTSYWSVVSRGLVASLSKAGYNLIFTYIKDSEAEALVMPQGIAADNVDGVIVLGALKADYVKELLKKNLPTVFVDVAVELCGTEAMRDTVLMENVESVCRITRCLIAKGHTRLGFIGDIGACQSYYERWQGFKKAHEEAGVPLRTELCITESVAHHYQYVEEIRNNLARFETLPTAFVCANDRIAIYLTKVLKEKGIKIPEEMAVTGFDDIFEATVVEPHLTTVRIYKEDIGKRAAEELLWRFQNPERPVEVVRIGTEVVFRGSTG